MARDYESVPHVAVHVDQEAALGVMAQDAVSTKSTVAYSADEDKIFGAPIMVVLKHKATADQAYDSAAAIVNVAGSKPVLSQKYRIVEVKTVMRSLRTGGTPDHDLRLELGDGAASEAFADAVATVDVDTDVANTDMVRIIVPAYAVWNTGCTLRSQLQVSGSTTGATAEFDVFVTLLPTN
jgi:hypothetical protein